MKNVLPLVLLLVGCAADHQDTYATDAGFDLPDVQVPERVWPELRPVPRISPAPALDGGLTDASQPDSRVDITPEAGVDAELDANAECP